MSDVKEDFEKEFFMCVNLLRENPLAFVTYMQTYINQGKKQGDSQTMFNNIHKKLKSLDKLDPIEINANGSKACYLNLSKNENNKSLIQDGAVKEYKIISKKDKSGMEPKDYCKKSWVGSALELVCDMLLSFYITDLNMQKDHFLIDKKTAQMGMSYYKMRDGNNLFQVLYILDHNQS